MKKYGICNYYELIKNTCIKISCLLLGTAFFASIFLPQAYATTVTPTSGNAYIIYQYGSGGKDCIGVPSDSVNTKGASIKRQTIAKNALYQKIAVTKNGSNYQIHFLGYSSANPTTSRDFVLDANDGKTVTQYTNVNNRNQVWALEKLDNGCYRIKSPRYNKYLTYSHTTGGYTLSDKKNNSTQYFEFWNTGSVTMPDFLKSSSSSNSSSFADEIIADARKDLGKTRSQLGYTTDWCAYWVSDLLRANGVSISKAGTPRDVVKNVLNANKGTYYSFRSANVASLKQNGLKNTSRIVQTSRSSVTPQKGDILIFLWTEDVGTYNWSHTGFVQSFSDNTIKTIEGNTSGGIVAEKNRAYDSTVVGVLRIN